MVCDFERSWDWQTLNSHNLWPPVGVVRNLFFDGFRSVLPWTGFVLFGMWLGRFDLQKRAVYWPVLLTAAGISVAAQGVSQILVSHFLTPPREGLDAETVNALFCTESIPALCLF